MQQSVCVSMEGKQIDGPMKRVGSKVMMRLEEAQKVVHGKDLRRGQEKRINYRYANALLSL